MTRSVRAALKLAILRICLNGLPAREHAVVAGFPDEEGNSVEVVRELAGCLPVYWLVAGDPESLAWLVSDADGVSRVRCVRKNSLRAYWAYVTARYVFFTHGLYGSPKPPRHKTIVNLWHGDGPKRRPGFATIRSTFVVSGTRLWGEPRAQGFGVGQHGVLICGNPRVDQFARPATDEALRELKLEARRPLVVWLPTYRTTRYPGDRLGAVRNWSDADSLSVSAVVQATLTQAVQDAEAMGVQLVLKPHQLDADNYASTGLHIITDTDLREARISLYQLLARADGLITDYSSVWTDFLVRDRPIGFYCPDLDQYVGGRGLNVDHYPSLLPGQLLEGAADFRTFLRDCVDEPAASRRLRRRAAVRIGAETRPAATRRLLDAVGVRCRDTRE
ncbi:MAG: CDP-glycerol glycerophosphotransferase family protein [Nocardioidaceae bacterium]|nr:CDP-glycerol glycerophosphotransferase family protein [Nocardioidaceae bacterium]